MPVNVKPIYLDLPGVAAVVSLSVSTIEALVRKGLFPAPRLLSGRRVGWLVDVNYLGRSTTTILAGLRRGTCRRSCRQPFFGLPGTAA